MAARIASTGSPGRSSRAEAARPTEIRAVVFDLDGVLLDTEPILRRVDEETMTPDEMRRRRGLRRVAIGVALIIAVIVFTIIIMPLYYR